MPKWMRDEPAASNVLPLTSGRPSGRVRSKTTLAIVAVSVNLYRRVKTLSSAQDEEVGCAPTQEVSSRKNSLRFFDVRVKRTEDFTAGGFKRGRQSVLAWGHA